MAVQRKPAAGARLMWVLPWLCEALPDRCARRVMRPAPTEKRGLAWL